MADEFLEDVEGEVGGFPGRFGEGAAEAEFEEAGFAVGEGEDEEAGVFAGGFGDDEE